MASQNQQAKLLDYWRQPSEAGEPVGCLATSFTFSTIFFEEECLARFVNMETDPNSDGPAYLVEREEKFSGLCCASVLVDQHHCRGNRSLRWDMIPAKLNRGVMHAKVTLLHWANLVRLIISSANLTEEGYRKNQEIFSVLDYGKTNSSPLDPLVDTIDFLKTAFTESYLTTDHPASIRWHEFLDRISNFPPDSSPSNEDLGNHETKVFPVSIAPEKPDIFSQLKEIWDRVSGSPADRAEIISPFYDPPESRNKPSKKIWDQLKQRGEAKVIYHITGEKDEENGELVLHGPKTLQTNLPKNRDKLKVDFKILKERMKTNSHEAIRPLHLKVISLMNRHWLLLMMGSSNFTTPGTGLSNQKNYEANLAYLVSKKNNPNAYKALTKFFLIGERITQPFRFLETPVASDDEVDEVEYEILPRVFESVLFDRDKKGLSFFVITFHSLNLPQGFEIIDKSHDRIIMNEQQWIANKRPLVNKVDWDMENIPTGFSVHWTGSKGEAYWPITIKSHQVLPPPVELKDLPLEVLIRILSSARPLYQVMRQYIKRKHSKENQLDYQPIIDFHKRVDTSSFLIQRTRRISAALSSFRSRMEKPVFTEDMLSWRLHGPVGLTTLAGALKKESGSEEEKAFLMAEIALELSRVEPRETLNSLKKEKIKSEIKSIIKDMERDTRNVSKKLDSGLKKYIKKAFRMALR